MDLSDLPNNVDTLKILVLDLNRRLQNAMGMVEMQKRIAEECMRTSESLKKELSETTRMIQLERMKNDTLHKKKIKSLESIRYRNMQNSTEKAQEELRDELIDNKVNIIVNQRILLA